MTLGIPGTGPYGRIRMLQTNILCSQYEIDLIAQGLKRGSKAGYQKSIAAARAEIRAIRASIKGGEKSSNQ